MASLNVWGQYMGGGIYLHPGESHHWVAWGGIAQAGVVPWISVAPLPFTDEEILEVSLIQHEATPDGDRRILYSVTNVGPGIVPEYDIFAAWTDII